MTMEKNEFALANTNLENEVKLTCSVEETPGKKIMLQIRNVTTGTMSPRMLLLDGHLNYTMESKEVSRLITCLKKLLIKR